MRFSPEFQAPRFVVVTIASLLVAGAIHAAEPVVTTFADFEDESIAASIGDVQNVLAADCGTRLAMIPARGRSCLAVDIGATRANAAVACDLLAREAIRFDGVDRLAAFCWIQKDELQFFFRLSDARGQVFETPGQALRLHDRWVRIVADVAPASLKRLSGDGALAWPVQVQGFRVAIREIGATTVFVDDIEVEHQVEREEIIRADFRFDEPTKIYEPGSSVGAKLILENRSRARAVQVTAELDWTLPDGSVAKTQRASANLPASGDRFRSRQPLDFSQRVDAPGLYRLVARVQAFGWPRQRVFETSIAVAPTNRNIPRGRSTFFGLATNLLREPVVDQELEIAVARSVGAHLLAIEIPWRLLEPKEQSYDFKTLDRVVQAATRRSIAVRLVLTAPPDWLAASGVKLAERRDAVLELLARRYGDRVAEYQLSGETAGGASLADQAGELRALQARLTAASSDVRVISAPIAVAPLEQRRAELSALEEETPFTWCFATAGDVRVAVGQLRQVPEKLGVRWRSSHCWLHRAAPLSGAGTFADAEDVLRYYVEAAAQGVSGLVWSELRDDDNDASRPDTLRGLTRRDFSPKTPLLGYATAVGMLTGLRYAGEVLGTPAELGSALFIGSGQQVAVVLARPNRIRPAVLMPIRGVQGEFEIRDFDRRPLELLASAAPPLVLTTERPMFVKLVLESAQPEPQVAFGNSWLQVPQRVFYGAEAQFAVAVNPPLPLQRSYLQLVVPEDSPLKSSLSATALEGAPGDKLSYDVELTVDEPDFVATVPLTVRISLEGRTLDVPIEAARLGVLNVVKPTEELVAAAHEMGPLVPSLKSEKPPTAGGVVYAAYEATALHLAIKLTDDAPVHPAQRAATPADILRVGIALAGSEAATEAEIRWRDGTAEITAADEAAAPAVAGWTCEMAGAATAPTIRLSISAASLGVATLSAGQRVLLAVRYCDADPASPAVPYLDFGGEQAGGAAVGAYRWFELR